MQLYKKILFIVGSELTEDENEKDFSPNQVTIMQQNDSRRILARLRFNEPIVFFKI